MSGQPQSNNGSSAVAKLLNQLNLPTLAMVLMVGGGNWFVTERDGRLTREEAERATREIHQMHSALDDFETRQKETLQKLNALLDKANKETK